MHFCTYAFLHLCIFASLHFASLHYCNFAFLHPCNVSESKEGEDTKELRKQYNHHIRKEPYIIIYKRVEKEFKGYSWLCVIFKNLGIDCYSNIFIAILNETLIRFFGLVNGMPGGNEKIRSTGVTLCYNFENVALSVSVLTQKKN